MFIYTIFYYITHKIIVIIKTRKYFILHKNSLHPLGHLLIHARATSPASSSAQWSACSHYRSFPAFRIQYKLDHRVYTLYCLASFSSQNSSLHPHWLHILTVHLVLVKCSTVLIITTGFSFNNVDSPLFPDLGLYKRPAVNICV